MIISDYIAEAEIMSSAPEPLYVGMLHRIQQVIPARRPADTLIFLRKQPTGEVNFR